VRTQNATNIHKNSTWIDNSTNTSKIGGVLSPVLAINSTTPDLEVEILVEGTGSMRLRSSDPVDIDIAVLQWYAYCEEYVLHAWLNSGYDKSPLVLSFDWIQIDSTRLDVFFVGVYPVVSRTEAPFCLSSEETLQNKTDSDLGYNATMYNNSSVDDVCSQMTLGNFGEGLISGSKAKITDQMLLYGQITNRNADRMKLRYRFDPMDVGTILSLTQAM